MPDVKLLIRKMIRIQGRLFPLIPTLRRARQVVSVNSRPVWSTQRALDQPGLTGKTLIVINNNITETKIKKKGSFPITWIYV